jgi:hypothetical protein
MASKQYGAADDYELKLKRVMERFKATEFDFDWNRKGNCWIRFSIDGEGFYFFHSVEQAKAAGINLKYGSDAFAQLVLTLEDLARANERGTFKLKKILGAMAMLEPPKDIPEYFKELGFDQIPSNYEEANKQYRKLSQERHKDTTGSDEAFIRLTKARDEAKRYFGEG